MELYQNDRSTILLTLSGSRAYGTAVVDSDTDYKGIMLPTRMEEISPFQNFEQFEFKGQNYEGTLFSLEKFFKLAANANPNVIEILFTRDQDVVTISEAGELLRANRQLFLSKRALYSFCGYATSQLKRIQTHKHWITNPPTHVPTRQEFGLPDQPLLSRDIRGAADSIIQLGLHELAPWIKNRSQAEVQEFYEALASLYSLKPGWLSLEASVKELVAETIGFETNLIQYLKAEKAFAQATQHYKQYQEWLLNRNEKRAALESKYGYDVKHGMHLVRLLRMCREIVETNDFNVYRPDRKELLAIRNGEWTYDEILSWAEAQTKDLYRLAKSNNCTLPDQPNQQELENLFINTYKLARANE